MFIHNKNVTSKSLIIQDEQQQKKLHFRKKAMKGCEIFKQVTFSRSENVKNSIKYLNI